MRQKDETKVVATPSREKMLMHEANKLAQMLAEIHSQLEAMHHLDD